MKNDINKCSLNFCLLWIFVFFFSWAAIFPREVQAQKTQKFERVLITTTSLQMAVFPIMLARERGFYRDEALDADLILMRPDLAIKAVITGEAQFSTPFPTALRAILSGYPLRMVMALMRANDFSLLVKPTIRKVEDLRGKTIAVSSPGATPDVSVRLILKKYGIVPDTETKILYISGGSGLRLAALNGGSADAALLGSPYNKMAVQLGLRELVFMKDLVQIPFNGLAASVTKLQTQPQSIHRTVRATLKGIRFIKENKDESLRFMAAKYGFNDKEVANLVYEDAVSLYLDTGIPTEASMKEAIDSAKQGMQGLREVSASDVADWRFAREAYSSVRSGR